MKNDKTWVTCRKHNIEYSIIPYDRCPKCRAEEKNVYDHVNECWVNVACDNTKLKKLSKESVRVR